jgi:HSP20 family protein
MKLLKRNGPETGTLAPVSSEWSPLRGLNRLHNEVDRVFDRLFGDSFGGWLPPATPLLDVDFPAVDVYEDKDNVFITAELPGMKKEDIDVSVSGDLLSIAGERKEETEHQGAEGYRSERYFGRFERSVPLPVPVEGDKIHAEYKDGILTITCPKTEGAKRKEIEIKVD